jgi:hypothetical protein
MAVALSPSPVFSWFTTGGSPAVGYQLFTYIAGTSTPQATYVDYTQTTQNTNPVILNSAGYANVWLVSGQIYKLVLEDAAGNLIWSVDQIPGGFAASAAFIGSVLWPLTPAEIATGSTFINTAYTYSDIRRTGVIADSSAAAAQNSLNLASYFNPLVLNGPTGNFNFFNSGSNGITGPDVYWFATPIPCRAGIHIDGNGSILNYTGSGVAADSDSGLFMAANDFSFVNGTILVNFATGVASSAGNAFWFGFRGSDSAHWPLNPVYDSLLATPQGGFTLQDVRIVSTITGANVGSSAAIAMTGGVQGVDFRNVYISGSGTGGMGNGIQYEFGWATSGTAGDTGQSSRQTSHLHAARFSNIVITNLDNVSAASRAIFLTGAYGCFLDGISISGCSTGIYCNPGESQYYRPWVGVDDLGTKHEMELRNITIEGASSGHLEADR